MIQTECDVCYQQTAGRPGGTLTVPAPGGRGKQPSQNSARSGRYSEVGPD